MVPFPVFLSIVCVLRNRASAQQELLEGLGTAVRGLVNDYELIVVDNASTDDSVAVLRGITGTDGLPNLQVYALTKEVDGDTASWVGLENALGDYVVVINPLTDDIGFLPQLLESAALGSEVVFASNKIEPVQGIAYRCMRWSFNWLYKWATGIHLGKEAPQYRVLSKRVVNFILQHPQPAVTYRHLPATGGFVKANLSYSARPREAVRKQLVESFNRGMRLLVSTTRAPMRLVTMLSLFGAFANIVYSVYIVTVGFFKSDVAPGWVSLSLQQSGMFFLISLVLLVLGEYILNMASLSNEGPPYHVGQDFTSAHMTRHEKLNLEEVRTSARTEPVPARHG
jgi:glycosyltransferase involved in cell wall biosynthesis